MQENLSNIFVRNACATGVAGSASYNCMMSTDVLTQLVGVLGLMMAVGIGYETVRTGKQLLRRTP